MKKYRASKLAIREVPLNQEKDFLKKNHKQGFVNSTFAIGLYDNEDLVQIETFGKPRIEIQSQNIIHDWELLRECSKKDCVVYGGKSRLLKHFQKETNCHFLLSYCSLTEGFDGHSYKVCGFDLVTTNSSYHYEYQGNVIQRYSMQKNANLRKLGKKETIQKTLEKYGKLYNSNLTEKQNAENAGFVCVQDLGNQTWEKRYCENLGYVYRTTNLLNGKTYIGQHKVLVNGEVKRRRYIGSGTVLWEAVKKYGLKNFKVDVLDWTTDFNELNDLETKYIFQERSLGKAEYNVADGGSGYTHKSGVLHWYNDSTKEFCCQENIDLNLGRLSNIKNRISSTLKGRKQSEETCTKKSLANKGKHKYNNGEKVIFVKPDEVPDSFVLGDIHSHFYGKKRTHTDATKKKISETKKQRKALDSNYGKRSLDVTSKESTRMREENKQRMENALNWIKEHGFKTKAMVKEELNISEHAFWKLGLKPVGQIWVVRYYDLK